MGIRPFLIFPWQAKILSLALKPGETRVSMTSTRRSFSVVERILILYSQISKLEARACTPQTNGNNSEINKIGFIL